MKTLYNVTACHPVAKRIDEYKLTEIEKNDLVTELQEAGYENFEITPKVYYEDGDEITITLQMFNEMDKDVRHESEAHTTIRFIIEQKAKNNKIDLDKTPLFLLFPLKGKLKSVRMNRSFGHLVVDWDIGEDPNGCDRFKHTNVYFLEKMGFNFIQPEYEEIPIMNANDNLLNETELVIKTYALQNNLSEKLAVAIINKIISAMSVHGIVFYRP